mmetsp:Transcript_13761/g.42993  ORF Transcript_13761/g.42993 Transcript_13761/m.42993 type:complete len:319 (-) Transcript_13761:29-985(-)
MGQASSSCTQAKALETLCAAVDLQAGRSEAPPELRHHSSPLGLLDALRVPQSREDPYLGFLERPVSFLHLEVQPFDLPLHGANHQGRADHVALVSGTAQLHEPLDDLANVQVAAAVGVDDVEELGAVGDAYLKVLQDEGHLWVLQHLLEDLPGDCHLHGLLLHGRLPPGVRLAVHRRPHLVPHRPPGRLHARRVGRRRGVVLVPHACADPQDNLPELLRHAHVLLGPRLLALLLADPGGLQGVLDEDRHDQIEDSKDHEAHQNHIADGEQAAHDAHQVRSQRHAIGGVAVTDEAPEDGEHRPEDARKEDLVVLPQQGL